MLEVFLRLAQAAATQAGFNRFAPDACLVNRYEPSAKLSLHQDKDERVPLFHGDVVVWGGVDRLRYHGVLPLKEGQHPLLGRQRINFTFRKAG